MAVKKYKPTTPGQRNKVISAVTEITAKKPHKSLLEPLHGTGGRNNTGQLTMRYIGGGHKKMYRVIDFLRDKDNCTATVRTIEYDPNRTARIALVQYEDGEYRYIIAPEGLKVGQVIASGSGVAPEVGNTLPSRKFLSVLSSTISNSVPARVPPWHAAPERSHSLPPVRETTRSFVCLQAKPAWCWSAAAQPWAPFPTATTTWRATERPDVPVTSDAGRTTAASS